MAAARERSGGSQEETEGASHVPELVSSGVGRTTMQLRGQTNETNTSMSPRSELLDTTIELKNDRRKIIGTFIFDPERSVREELNFDAPAKQNGRSAHKTSDYFSNERDQAIRTVSFP